MCSIICRNFSTYKVWAVHTTNEGGTAKYLAALSAILKRRIDTIANRPFSKVKKLYFFWNFIWNFFEIILATKYFEFEFYKKITLSFDLKLHEVGFILFSRLVLAIWKNSVIKNVLKKFHK